jgi:hypothetical protein
MLYTCIVKFNVTKNLKKIYKIFETKQVRVPSHSRPPPTLMHAADISEKGKKSL